MNYEKMYFICFFSARILDNLSWALGICLNVNMLNLSKPTQGLKSNQLTLMIQKNFITVYMYIIQCKCFLKLRLDNTRAYILTQCFIMCMYLNRNYTYVPSLWKLKKRHVYISDVLMTIQRFFIKSILYTYVKTR